MIKKLVILVFLLILLSCQSSKKEVKMSYITLDFDRMWNYNDPASTELKFQTLLDSIITTDADYDKSYHLQLLTQLARTKGLQSKFDEGHELLDQVEDLLVDDLKTARMRYLLERGRLYNSAGKKEKARPLFLQAWQLGTKSNLDLYSLDAAHMMGIVEPIDQQLSWNLKALELARNSKDKRTSNWLGPLYNNIGWTYHDQAKYNKALEMFQQDLAWRNEIGDENGARISSWSVARAQRSLGNINEALKIQLELEKEVDQLNLPKDGYVYEELGEIYLLKDQPDLSGHYFKLAYEILSQDKWLQSNEPDRLQRISELSSQ